VLREPLADGAPRPGDDVEDSFGEARLESSARRSALRGVSPAGLSTTVLAHASAGASFQLAMFRGKFHGVISPTTPSGSRKVMSTPPATGMVSP
jgi:hypothetical protein